ncbi:MAG: FAD:protein FMN transferase [Steroidobacter sp.]
MNWLMCGVERLVVVSLAIAVAACGRTPEELAISGPTMGTTFSVKVADPPRGVDAAAIRAATDEVLDRVDRSMSGYRVDSEISRFNASTSTRWFEVSVDLATVVDVALKVSQQSDGAFDITVGPVVAAWGFGASGEPIDLPNDAQLAELRSHVGYQKLRARLNPPALRKSDAALVVDLNGIAPGYAVDLLALRLQAMEIRNFMIDIGGEVRAQGRNARGQLWRIAVERPVDAEPEPYAIVQLDNASVTTSGEYRHYYTRDGRRYSHTIDPRTGQPVEHSLASVVVIGTTSMYADAWATAFNVLGTREGHALATKLDMPVLFIDRDDESFRSVTTEKFSLYLAPQ